MSNAYLTASSNISFNNLNTPSTFSFCMFSLNGIHLLSLSVCAPFLFLKDLIPQKRPQPLPLPCVTPLFSLLSTAYIINKKFLFIIHNPSYLCMYSKTMDILPSRQKIAGNNPLFSLIHIFITYLSIHIPYHHLPSFFPFFLKLF